MQPLDPARQVALGAELQTLLTSQLARVRGRFLLHGTGMVLLLPLAAVLLAFLLDHALRLPWPVRMLHTTAITGLLVYATARWIRYPLHKAFSPVEVALWVERCFPALHQRLVSSIQLQATLTAGDDRNQSTAMIQQLLAETAEAARALPLQRLLDGRRTSRIWAGAGSLLLLLLAGAIIAPDTARAFCLRQLGFDASYPKSTRLVLELPPASAELQRRDDGRQTELVLPAGADLHVSVLAEGQLPSEVFLDVDGGGGMRAIGMTKRPANRFRHVFRRINSGFTFHARGGDDDDGDRVVTVRTVHPPMVAQIQAHLTPPAYTGEPASDRSGGAIEALTGTQVQLQVTATSAIAGATMVFLESGRRIELTPLRIVDDAVKSPTWSTTFTVEKSDRYQIDLTGDGGLRNPNPGTYPIAALLDYAPVGHWLLPEDEGATLLLPEALLAVRCEAKDDFGLLAVSLTVEAVGKQREFPLLSPLAAGAPRPKSSLPLLMLEVKDLLGGQKAGLDGIALTASLQDNRLPEAQVTLLPRRSVQVVDSAQLGASIGRLFRALREDVQRALELQQDRKSRIDEVLEKDTADPAQVLTAVEVGQGRVLAAGEAAHRQLMRAFDLHLWNRLETSKVADEVVQLWQTFHRDHAAAEPYAAEFYRDLLARRKAGTLGAMPTVLDPILGMVANADLLRTELGPLAMRLCAEAQVGKDQGQRRARLQQLTAVQARMQTALEQLLAQLDEWNDYQDVIQETRALRDRQKDVQTRTEEIRGKKQ